MHFHAKRVIRATQILISCKNTLNVHCVVVAGSVINYQMSEYREFEKINI